jgi:hypothetical protein
VATSRGDGDLLPGVARPCFIAIKQHLQPVIRRADGNLLGGVLSFQRGEPLLEVRSRAERVQIFVLIELLDQFRDDA